MNDVPSNLEEVIGTVVVLKGGSVVVRLADGSEVLCRSAMRLHRPLGFHLVPVGRQARVRFHPVKPERMPLLVEVLREERPG